MATQESVIRNAIERAVLDYIAWQRGKIGRDINPDELVQRVKEAGAKRLQILSPTFTKLSGTDSAIPSTIAVAYGGMEDE